MTQKLQRTALFLLAGTALTACASPKYAINITPSLPPPAAPAPPTRLAAAPTDTPTAARSPLGVKQTQLAALPQAAAPAPLIAVPPPGEDAAARAKSRSKAASAPAETYTVKSGDTLEKIAARLNTDIPTLAKVNGLKKPYRLQPGQELKNPNATAAKAAKASEPTESRASSGGTYVVKSGDTLFSIAKEHGTTVEALRTANGMGSGSSIMPGRKLKLPGERAAAADEEVSPAERTSSRNRRVERQPEPEPEVQASAGSTRSVTGRVVEISIPGEAYKVRKGDTLEKAARKLDSDIEELARINKLKKPYRLQPGQTLRGPGSTAKAYVVGRGDTLAEIARRFDVSVEQLRSANGLRRGAAVAPGRKLRLPAGYRDRGPIVTRTVAPEPPAPRYTPPAPVTRPTPTPYPATPQYPRATSPTPPSSFETPAPAGQTPPPVTSAPVTPTPVTPTPVTPSPVTPPTYSSPPRPPTYSSPARPPTTSNGLPTAPQPYSGTPRRPPSYSTPSYSTPPSGGVVGAPTASPPLSDAQVMEMGRGRFVWPVRGDVISSFGSKGTGQRNDGLNIRAPTGEPVKAAAAGEVVYAGDQVPGFGNLVLIKHPDGWVTAYGHLGRVDVRMQQRVLQGEQIGQAGSTGGVSEPQLHFEVRYSPTPQERARPIDPSLVLPQ